MNKVKKIKESDVRKNDYVFRLNLVACDSIVYRKFISLKAKKPEIKALVGKVVKIESNGKIAHIKWLGSHRSVREPLVVLKTFKRKGTPRKHKQ